MKILLLAWVVFFSSCISNIMAGANIVYDRHHVYKKSADFALAAKVGHALKMDPALNCPSNKCFEIAVFHGDILLLGTVPSALEKDKATELIQNLGNYRHLYNFIDINPLWSYNDNWDDPWITTQIRSKIIANADIDPEPFKIISRQNTVYIMGDVLDDQESLILEICRNTNQVNKVINLLQVYTLKKRQSNTTPFNDLSPKLPDMHNEG